MLGAGGVLGHAHVGVLEVFDQSGIHFDRIVGASVGAVVGALYGSGIRGRSLERLAKAVRPRHWMDFSLNRMGLVAGKRLEAVLRLVTRDLRLEEMTPPLVVAATDIETGEKVVLDEGPAAPAVLASSAVPGIFPPISHAGRKLMDGAILERVPVSVARELGAEAVVAVSLGFPRPGQKIPVRNAFEVILKSFDLMQWEIFRHSEEMADVHIRPAFTPPSDGESSAEALLEQGREAARAAVPAVLALLRQEKAGISR